MISELRNKVIGRSSMNAEKLAELEKRVGNAMSSSVKSPDGSGKATDDDDDADKQLSPAPAEVIAKAKAKIGLKLEQQFSDSAGSAGETGSTPSPSPLGKQPPSKAPLEAISLDAISEGPSTTKSADSAADASSAGAAKPKRNSIRSLFGFGRKK